MSNQITCWQDPKDGMWLGYWNDYPDYQTEGYSIEDLKDMLLDIRNAIANGLLGASSQPNSRQLAFA